MEPKPPHGSRVPPPGVPRWLWPPAGAVVRRVVLREESPAGGDARYEVLEGGPPEESHLRALQWLVGEFPRDDVRSGGRRNVTLEIARTDLRGGKVGHAYALDGKALGDPGNAPARGVLWRYALSVLGGAPPEFDHWEEEL